MQAGLVTSGVVFKVIEPDGSPAFRPAIIIMALRLVVVLFGSVADQLSAAVLLPAEPIDGLKSNEVPLRKMLPDWITVLLLLLNSYHLIAGKVAPQPRAIVWVFQSCAPVCTLRF